MSPGRAPRHRRVETSAVTAIIPVVAMLPFWAIAIGVVWWPLHRVWAVPFWQFALGWAVAGVLLFVPAVQARVLAPLLGARVATSTEAGVIAPVWSSIAAEARLPSSRYIIRVIDSDELNAFACGGHLVIVTTFAVERLTQRQLAGVFAHELSHHLGLHTVALTIGHWFSLPVLALARVGFFLQNVAQAATETFAVGRPASTVVGKLAAGLLTAFSWVFLSGLLAADRLNNMVGHRAEFDADDRAIELGYGKHLAEALNEVIRHSPPVHRSGWRGRLAASHPSPRTRMVRIQAGLRSRRSARQRR